MCAYVYPHMYECMYSCIYIYENMHVCMDVCNYYVRVYMYLYDNVVITCMCIIIIDYRLV